jgi:uncharacterized circularly permuted ATP-grasp superfamily protein/uncharacterized alpha-E superfamily protein
MLSPVPPLGADPAAPYRPRAGTHDELVDEHGEVRPHWAPFLAHLGQLGPEEIGRRWVRAQELIHENGVSYNVHGDIQGMDRPWPLSPVPVVLSTEEWTALSAGLIQRARLLERVLDDLYGPQRLIAEGLVPPALVFGNPGFLRPCQGQPVPDGRWLPLYAVDVVRGPDGRFRVLSDRTQIPTGAGYALENRIIVGRTFPEAFRACQVQRLAHFFRTMRDSLARLAPRNRDNPRVVVLTLGPSDPTYFEQAFLAQYLGYPLVHGGDLTVRGARVYLKTLGGLHAVDVILRRVNDELCDPLELRPDGMGGIPGLVQAVRERAVALANPLGSGFAATPALLSYLGPLCRHLLGEDLRLASVDTSWCGDEGGRKRTVASVQAGDPLVLKPAFSLSQTQPLFVAGMDPAARAALAGRVQADPAGWVAQEQVTLATTPALVDDPTPAMRDQMEPRHWVLRCFLVGTSDGHVVMPGGLTRFAPSPETLEVSIQRGGRSKDTWVGSGGPVPSFSLLRPPTARIALSRGGADLPSRVGDNLFWLGRYAERAEGLARLGRVIAVRLGDQPADAAPAAELAALVRALAALAGLGETVVPDPAPGVLGAWEAVVMAALRDVGPGFGLAATLRALQRVARECRDRLSGDSWRVLMRVAVSGPGGLRPSAADAAKAVAVANSNDDRPGRKTERPAALLPALDNLVVMLSALSGIVGDSMTRGLAWRFLDMGRRLERAAGLVTLLAATLDRTAEREGPLLEMVLEAADSGMTYRRRYLNQLAAAPVLDLLLTDETNPRAVIFQVNNMVEHLAGLPHDTTVAVRSPEQRLALELRAELQLADVEALAEAGPGGVRAALVSRLERWGKALPALSDSMAASYLSHAAQSRQLSESSRGEAP